MTAPPFSVTRAISGETSAMADGRVRGFVGKLFEQRFHLGFVEGGGDAQGGHMQELKKVIQTVREKFSCKDCQHVGQPFLMVRATPTSSNGGHPCPYFVQGFNEHGVCLC